MKINKLKKSITDIILTYFTLKYFFEINELKK